MNIGWKIYFWIYLILSLLGIFALLKYAPLRLFDFIGILLSVVLTLATYSYVFKKKILPANNWKILLWIVLFLFIEEMVELFILPKDFLVNLFPFLQENIPVTAEQGLLSWLLSFPGIYAIYKLASK